MKLVTTVFASLVLIAGFSIAASAQRNGGGNINARERRQERRIRNGVNNGSLTPKEAAELQKKEEKVRELKQKLQENGLTPKERKRIEKQLDKLNKEIWKLEHNNQRRTN